MKRINLILASLILFGLMTGCGGGSGSNVGTSGETQTVAESDAPAGITMTFEKRDKIKFTLRGSQTVSVDWGDGSPVKEYTLEDPSVYYTFAYDYAKPAAYTIQITGENITGFDIEFIGITNLELNVTTLENLSCGYNKLTTLDVSKNPALKTLSCHSNQLTTLDVSKNPALKDLWCNNNQLTTLDVSKNPALKDLWCNNNQLTTLDVSKNPVLEELRCGVNQLTSLDVSKKTKLKKLECGENQLTTLNASKNPALEELRCYANQLTSINVSNCEKLEIIVCTDNKLSEEALNTLLSALCVAVYEEDPYYMEFYEFKQIYIGGNPGTETCNRTIAEKKGWKVEDFNNHYD